MSTITWAGNSGKWSAGSSWVGGVVPGSADVATILASSGPDTITLDDTRSVGGVTLNAAGALLQLTGDLSMFGDTFAVQAGTLLVSGTLEGATLVQSGATILFSNVNPVTKQIVSDPTLSGVTVSGTLDLSASAATVDVQGLQQTGSRGIKIGVGSQLLVLDSESLLTQTIDLAGGVLAEDGPSLVIGGDAVVVQGAAGTTARLGGDATAALVGLGEITNEGTILANAGTLVLATASGGIFGTFAAGTAPPPVRNLGTIEIAAGADLVDYVSGNVASLGTILNAGGLLDLAGTLDNSANTLTVGATGPFSNLLIDASVSGGTIVVAGGTLGFGSGASGTVPILKNVALVGAGASFDLLYFGVGTNLNAGGAPFTLSASGGQYGYIDLANGADLANAILTYASGAITMTIGTDPGSTATLDATTTIDVGAGQFLTLAGGSTGTLIDAATINVARGGVLAYGSAVFTTTGTLNIAPGATVRLTSFNKLADLGHVVGSGGTLVNAGSFDLGGGTIDLSGSGAFSTVTNVGGLVNGTIIQSTGTYQVTQAGLSNATFQGSLNLTANGSLALGGNVHLTGATGTGRGTISATSFPAPLIGGLGISTRIDIADGATLSGAEIDLSGYSATLAGVGANINGVSLNGVVTFAPDVLVNAGTANGGNSLIFGGGLVSQGTIAVAAGADLLISPYNHTAATNFVNSGLVTIAAGGTLDIDAKTSIAALGTILDPGGLLRLLNVTGTITSGGQLDNGLGIGTYDNTATTLTIGSGSGQIAALELEGAQINGGTIVNAGGSFAATSVLTQNASNLPVTVAATLNGVTFIGALHLGNAPNSNGASTAGALTFVGGTLESQSVTIDANAQLNFGADQSFAGATLALAGNLADVGHTLSLDSQTMATVTGNVYLEAGHFLNAGTITVAPGGFFDLQDDGAASSPETATSGVIVIAGGQLITGELNPGQTAELQAGGLLSVSKRLDAGATVAFQGPGELLMSKTTTVNSTITGFGPADTIDVAGFQDFNFGSGPSATVAYDGANLTVLGAQGQTIDTFAIGAGYSLSGFHVGTGSSSIIVTDYAVTYTAPGTSPAGPTIAGTVAALPTTDESSINPFATVLITDPNAGAIDTAIVSVSGYQGVLSNLGGGSFNNSTYSIVGSAAVVQAALRGLVFTPTAHVVVPKQTATTNFKLVVSDPTGIATDTTTSVVATAVQDPLVLAGATPVIYASDAASNSQPFKVVSLADPDAGTYSATVKLNDTSHASFGNSFGATIDANGVFTASGSLAAVVTALQNLVIYTPSHQVATGQTITTGVTLSVSDAAGQTVGATSTLIVVATGTADAKGLQILGTTPGQPVLDTGTIAPFAGAIVVDPNEPGVLDRLTVTLSNAANGTLSDLVGGQVNGGTFTVSGTVDSTGLATSINKALAALVFTPTKGQGAPGATVTTSFTLTASNAAGTTTDAASSVIATATVQGGPLIGGTSSTPVVTASPQTLTPFAAITLTDSNVGASETVTVTLTTAGAASDAGGALSGAGLTKTGTGTYALAAGTAAAVQAALRALVFTPVANPSTTPITTGLSVTVSDGIAAAVTDANTMISDGQSSVAPVAAGTTLPDVSPFFTPAVYAILQSTLAGLQPSGTLPSVVSVAGGGSASAAVSGALNAYVVTVAGTGASTAPVGYAAGYVLNGASSLQDAAGTAVLIAAAGSATLLGSANDTLFGGNGNATIIAGGGAETVYGGTGTNLIELGSSTAFAATQGTDTIVGTSGAATINATGAPIYFGGSGTAVFNALGAAATLVGGGAQTVNANGAAIEMFAGPGVLTYVGGSGLGTVVSGSGGASLTGGSGGLLYFGNGPSTYTPGSAVDTVLGFSGSLTAVGGANGTLFFSGTAGHSNISSGAGSSTIVGIGAGDLLTATGAGKDVISATGAADTINGSASSGTNTYFAFGAGDVVQGGSGLTAIESLLGNQTLIAGSGSTLFEIVASGVRTINIGGFNPTIDYVQFQGYAAGTGAAALPTATTVAGSEVLSLSDGTKITFQGITGLTAKSFV